MHFMRVIRCTYLPFPCITFPCLQIHSTEKEKLIVVSLQRLRVEINMACYDLMALLGGIGSIYHMSLPFFFSVKHSHLYPYR